MKVVVVKEREKEREVVEVRIGSKGVGRKKGSENSYFLFGL